MRSTSPPRRARLFDVESADSALARRLLLREAMPSYELIALRASKERAPELRAALDSHFEYERRRAAREMLVYVVVAASVLLWPAAAWPDVFPQVLRRLAVGAWALGFAGVWIAWVSELRLLRRRDRYAWVVREGGPP